MAIVSNIEVLDHQADDKVTLKGIVDGAAIEIPGWKSHFQQIIANTAGTLAEKRRAARREAARLLKEEAARRAPPAPVAIDVGTDSETV